MKFLSQISFFTINICFLKNSKIVKSRAKKLNVKFVYINEKEKLLRITKPTFEHLGELEVLNTDNRDGLKLHLEENAWALIRFSGTEPLIRIYAEGSSPDQVKKIIENCRMIVDG